MPIYTYKCNECGNVKDHFRHIEERNAKLVCECNGNMLLSIQPVRFNNPIGGHNNPGYESPMSGEFITTVKQRREEMKVFDVVEKG